MKESLTALRRVFPYLPARDRRFLMWFAAVAAILAVIDVFALMLLALTLGSVAVGGEVSLPIVGLVPNGSAGWIIGIMSAVVVAKSVTHVWMQRIATKRFAALQMAVGGRLFAAYIRAPWSSRMSRNTADILQLADTGIAALARDLLMPWTNLPGLIFTSVGVVIMLVVSQPLPAIVAIVYLGGIAVLQYRVLGPHVRQAGQATRNYSLKMSRLISGMVSAQKEIILRDQAGEVEQIVSQARRHVSRARANLAFLMAVPRFVYDAAVIGGFALAGGAAYITGGISQAISAIALYGIAGFRLVPSLTSFQSYVTQLQAAVPYVERVIRDIEDCERLAEESEAVGDDLLPPDPQTLQFRQAVYSYPGAAVPAVDGISLDIPLGSSVGIAGPSGAGKSTLVDIMLGILAPTSGSVQLDGIPLVNVLAQWRKRIGYVPQSVALFDGTIAQNVALTWGEDINRERVIKALQRARLWQAVKQRPLGLDERIGEGGTALSGGQRQRLGIARALYTEPLILVLDEATSALDNLTESEVAEAIQSLHGDMTVIAIAHRLSTIKDAQLVVYMSDGHIVAQGSFDHVVASSSEFAIQARLAGLA
jgi:ABC-type multidrug transport system fused ATPase/permease subunit